MLTHNGSSILHKCGSIISGATFKDVLMAIPKSDLLGTAMAVQHEVGK